MNFSLWQSIPLTFCLIATHAFHSFAGPPEINGFLVSVEGETVTLRSKDGKMPQEVIVPRLFNGVRRLRIIEGEQTILGNVQPEIQTWKLGWPKSSIDWSKAKIELELDGIPQWESATSPAEADGSFRLKGSQALTHGSKLRYEPQPHKNTVGYWADASDHAWWTLELTQGSKFNVAALQGCGAGQGGAKWK